MMKSPRTRLMNLQLGQQPAWDTVRPGISWRWGGYPLLFASASYFLML